jgi:hypothetical protein
MRMLAYVVPLAVSACATAPPPATLPTATPAQALSPWEKLGLRVVDGVPQLDDVEIELERTKCYGWCPAYTVKLSGNGSLTYTGESYVKTKGERHDVIDPQRLLPILEGFAEIGFPIEEHRCAVMVTDTSAVRLSLRIGSRSNSVWDRIGDYLDYLSTPMPVEDTRWHRRMTTIARSVDALAGIEAWIGTQAEREAHRKDWR